jgi:uncharacterized protein YigA (DUF484 family)
MSSPTEQPHAIHPSWPTGEAVKAFLRRHPAFLADDPELLAAMVPSGSDDSGNVVDLQNFVIQRLQRENDRLKTANNDLLAAHDGALIAYARVQEAVLALLGARSFDHFIALATGEVPGLLALDILTFCLESPENPPPPPAFQGVRVLPVGSIDALLGSAHDLMIGPGMRADATVFGADAAMLHSQALVRIHLGDGAPAGLLALGSRFADAFEGEAAADLLAFFGRVVEQCIRIWLELHG